LKNHRHYSTHQRSLGEPTISSALSWMSARVCSGVWRRGKRSLACEEGVFRPSRAADQIRAGRRSQNRQDDAWGDGTASDPRARRRGHRIAAAFRVNDRSFSARSAPTNSSSGRCGANLVVRLAATNGGRGAVTGHSASLSRNRRTDRRRGFGGTANSTETCGLDGFPISFSLAGLNAAPLWQACLRADPHRRPGAANCLAVQVRYLTSATSSGRTQ